MKNKTIYLTVAITMRAEADEREVIEECDYFFEHSAIEAAEIQEIMTEEEMVKGLGKTMEHPSARNGEYFKAGRF